MSPTTDQKPRTTDPQRARLLRILHREGALRGLDHAALSEGAQLGYQVGSLAELTLPQLRDYIQRLGTRLSGSQPGVAPASRRCTRPAGKRRPEGVVWLCTPKQRKFIASLLEQYFADDRDPVACAVRYVRARIGADLPADVGLPTMKDIADQVQTGKAAGMLIKALIGDLKRAGRWGRKL